MSRNRAGYGLLRSAGESGIHLGRLVAGSEGTLAIVLQAVLRTVPLPAAQGVVVLPFVGLSDAAAFVTGIAGPHDWGVFVRPVRPPVDQSGSRRRPVIPRLDR